MSMKLDIFLYQAVNMFISVVKLDIVTPHSKL